MWAAQPDCRFILSPSTIHITNAWARCAGQLRPGRAIVLSLTGPGLRRHQARATGKSPTAQDDYDRGSEPWRSKSAVVSRADGYPRRSLVLLRPVRSNRSIPFRILLGAERPRDTTTPYIPPHRSRLPDQRLFREFSVRLWPSFFLQPRPSLSRRLRPTSRRNGGIVAVCIYCRNLSNRVYGQGRDRFCAWRNDCGDLDHTVRSLCLGLRGDCIRTLAHTSFSCHAIRLVCNLEGNPRSTNHSGNRVNPGDPRPTCDRT